MPIILSAPFIIPETGIGGDMVMPDQTAGGGLIQGALRNEPYNTVSVMPDQTACGGLIQGALRTETLGSDQTFPNINFGGIT